MKYKIVPLYHNYSAEIILALFYKLKYFLFCSYYIDNYLTYICKFIFLNIIIFDKIILLLTMN